MSIIIKKGNLSIGQYMYVVSSMNEIIAGTGDTTYTLVNNELTTILNTLPSGFNSTLTLQSPLSGITNETTLHFSTGSSLPTIIYSGFTPIWGSGISPILNINKYYVFTFEQVKVSSTTWIVKSYWEEF